MTEYSHDGLRDSLTQLAAPTSFYEELRRALARANRQEESISLVRFILKPNHPISNLDDSARDSLYEETVLSFAQTLILLCREEDLCARMGELEFVSILPGAELAPLRLISRISTSWNEHFERDRSSTHCDLLRLETSYVLSRPLETSLEILDRLDSA